MDAAYIAQITKALLEGAGTTLGMFFVVLVASIPLGFLLTLIARGKIAPLRWLVNIYIFVLRGTPLLLQLMVMYFGVPILFGNAFKMERTVAAAVAFILNYAAYFAEIFRGGLLAIDKGQYEAGKVLGMNKFQVTTRVIIPQMFRVAMPSVTNEAVTLVKDTSLLYAVSVAEILHYAKSAVVRDSNMTGFVVAGAIYLVMNSVITMIMQKIEKKMDY